MPRKRTEWSIDENRDVVVGWFHELRRPGQSWTPRYDLCSIGDYLFKHTARGLVRRSEVEMRSFITRLRAEKLKELLEVMAKADEERVAKATPYVRCLLQDWLKEVEEFRDPGTLRMYRKAVTYYEEALGDHPIDEFSSFSNRKLRAHLERQGLSLASQYKYMSYIRTFFAWAAKRGFCSPKEITMPSKIRREPKVYSPEQLETIWTALESAYRDATNRRRKKMRWNQIRAFRVALETAMRAGELVNLRLVHIDLQKRIIKIRATEDWKPKADKERDVPISKRLHTFLKDDLAARSPGECWLLDQGDGTKAYRDSSALGHPLSKLCRDLGISGVKPWHGIRASVITHLLEKTGDLPRVQKLAGHTDIQTTRGYLNSERLSLQEMVDEDSLMEL